MKPNEIKKLLKVAKDAGIKRFSFEGFECEFFSREQKDAPEKVNPKPPQVVSLIQSEPDPDANLSYQEMLLRSSPVFDLMQEAKEQVDKLA